MRRVRVQIQEYEVSEMYVEETLHTTSLDLPKEALNEIKKVAQKFDNKNFIVALRKRIARDVGSCTESGEHLCLPRYEISLLLDLDELEGLNLNVDRSG